LFAVFKFVDQTSDAPARWRARKTLFDRYFQTWPVMKSDQTVRCYGFFRMVEDSLEVTGDIVECGVGRGGSIVTLCYAVSFFGADKTVYGFDSFSGFPNAVVHDISERVKSVGKVSGWADTSPWIMRDALEQDRSRNAKSLLLKRHVNLELVPGFFNETLPGNLPERIALLHVDCDLYDSTMDVLSNCLPRMSAGGVIVLDEYDDERWPGAKKAVDEVCNSKGLTVEYREEVQRYCIRVAATERSYAPQATAAR
jgi:hypothetical protein